MEVGSGGGQPPTTPDDILPWLEAKDIQDLVIDTLKKASKSLETAANVNKAVLMFGTALVLVSFVFASITSTWEVVTFGGLGIAAIIASLITNPLKAIGMGARRLIQVHVAYMGFLNQLRLLRSSPRINDEAALLGRSKRLSEAVEGSLEALQKYFG